MPVHRIDDPDDPRLDDFRDIRDRDARGPDGRPGVFIGEQGLVVEKMLARPEIVRRILVSEPRRPWLEDTLAAAGHPNVEALVAPKSILEAIVGFEIHRGIVASGDRRPFDDRTIEDIIPPRDRPATVLVCESIRNIDNIGALFRVAAAFGVDAVVLSPDCHDPLYRKSLRVSIGHALSIPFARSRDWASDLAALGDRHGLLRIGASVGDGSIRADTVPEGARRGRVAIVMGSEFDGLSMASTSACDTLVRIAMAADVDSLNVAVAAAVLLDRFTTASRI
jgi:tRNA G18 (ribose-2'-O)-methylase SpoU